jgi:hypothetical protein
MRKRAEALTDAAPEASRSTGGRSKKRGKEKEVHTSPLSESTPMTSALAVAAPSGSKTTGGRRKGRGNGKEDSTSKVKDDDLVATLTNKLAWASKFLNEGRLNKRSYELDASRFLPPEVPAKIRVFDEKRIDLIYGKFLPTSMIPAKILLVDVDKDLNKVGKFFTEPEQRSSNDPGVVFNIVRNPSEEFGMPWVIGGYHSSAALVRWSKERGEKPLRLSHVYRLSDIPGDTYEDKMKLARFLAVQDNISGQSTEGYDAQPFLVSTRLWRDMYLKAGSPQRAAKGHQPKLYKDFQLECASGDEKVLKQLTSETASTLTPRFKVVSLDEDHYQKAFTIMSSMDTREVIGKDEVVRLPNVVCKEPREEEEEEGDEQAEKAAKKAAKCQRTCTVEDMKECMRMPAGDLYAFLDAVADHGYVDALTAKGSEDLDKEEVCFTPSVGLFDAD